MAYLDAHWEREIPTRNEPVELANWGGNWVAIIDDFKIPEGLSYGFDQYEDKTVDINLKPAYKEFRF